MPFSENKFSFLMKMGVEISHGQKEPSANAPKPLKAQLENFFALMRISFLAKKVSPFAEGERSDRCRNPIMCTDAWHVFTFCRPPLPSYRVPQRPRPSKGLSKS